MVGGRCISRLNIVRTLTNLKGIPRALSKFRWFSDGASRYAYKLSSSGVRDKVEDFEIVISEEFESVGTRKVEVWWAWYLFYGGGLAGVSSSFFLSSAGDWTAGGAWRFARSREGRAPRVSNDRANRDPRRRYRYLSVGEVICVHASHFPVTAGTAMTHTKPFFVSSV